VAVVLGWGLYVSAPVTAAVKCFPEPIKSIQIARGGDVFYTTLSGVRRKLTHLSQPEAMAMLDIIRDAMGTSRIIQISYPDGYNCKQPDLEVHADLLMMQDPAVQ